MAMNKTEQRILDALRNGSNGHFYRYAESGGVVPLDGLRAVRAGQTLVDMGLVVWVTEPDSYSYRAGGCYSKLRWTVGASVKLVV